MLTCGGCLRVRNSLGNKKFLEVLDFFVKVVIMIPVLDTEDLCNGSTPDSDSVCGGSNPSSSAIRFTQDSPESWVSFFIHRF